MACAFDATGRLWTVRASREGFVMELRAPGSAELLAAAPFSNAYYAAGGAALRPGASKDSALIETYSGQSEQQYHLCSLVPESRLVIEHVSSFDGDQQVFVSDEGTFAISLDHCEPSVVRYPPGFASEQTRRAWPDYDENECEDERPGYHCTFLDAAHALVSSSEGRMFLLNTAELGFASELHVAGHAPVPVSVKYPTLSTPGLASDLITFERCEDSLIAFFAENRRSSAPSYVVLPITAILANG